MSEKTYSLEMTIRSLLGNKRYSTIKDILITLNAADIAAIFAELEPDMLPLLFRLLPKELAADTFVEMDPDQQELLIVRGHRRALHRRRGGPGGRDARQRSEAYPGPGGP